MHFVAVKKSRKLSGVVIYFMSAARVGRAGGHSTKLCTGRLHPEVQPLTLSYAIFDRKETPFVYLLLTNSAPVTYLV